jgi:hypothetical protein
VLTMKKLVKVVGAVIEKALDLELTPRSRVVI